MSLFKSIKNNLKEYDDEEYDDELEINYYKHFDHVNDVWNYLEGSTSEDDLNERISEVDPHKFGSIYYDLHDDGNGATVIIDYQSDNEDYYEKVDVYFNENINEAELQSLFTIITDEARKHNNYAHYSPREVDSQDIKNMIKDLKRKGGREVKSNVYALEDFIYDLNNGITVSENNEDEYKVVPVNEAENNNVAYVICYGTLEIWPDKDSAREYYEEGIAMSEGAEQQRYGNIAFALYKGSNFGDDEGPEMVTKIVDKNTDGSDKSVRTHCGRMTHEQAFDYINKLQKLIPENEETNGKVYECNDCGKEFEDGQLFNTDADGNVLCPYCGSGDIIKEE